ncbi:MAG: phosphatidylserine decarboxylase, partial [Balneolales bacterium]|nr:phosphatidylserine decarboxylase [Balneolales bacterium]
KEIEEGIYLKTKATQISIFLSPLDVHVNRNPVSGLLEYVKYHPGKKLMAWDEHASDLNERADFGVKHRSGTKIFFKQITGFLARRIVYHIQEGDDLKVGERFGMMKFGSRMDVIVPENVEIRVKEGDRTRAGESILAEIKS